MNAAVDWLIAPLSTETFRRQLPQRDWLHLRQRQPDHYAALFSESELVRLLWEQGEQMAELVYAHQEDRTRYPPQASVSDLAHWARQQYDGGATVVVNSVSRHSLPVARLCEALADLLDAEVVANAYWAPPDARGYAEHFDTDDTAFLQIAGSKHWRLHPPLVELPLRAQLQNVDPDWLEAGQTLWLTSGDLLYVPRGVIHTPLAGNQGSLHLTLGVRHMLWHDVLAEALRRLAETDLRLSQRADQADCITLESLLESLTCQVQAHSSIADLCNRLRQRRPRKPIPGKPAGGSAPGARLEEE